MNIQLDACKTTFPYNLKLGLISKVPVQNNVQRTPRDVPAVRLLERKTTGSSWHVVAKGSESGMPAASVPLACSGYEQSALLGTTSLKLRYLQARCPSLMQLSQALFIIAVFKRNRCFQEGAPGDAETCDLERGEELHSGLTGVVQFSVRQVPKPNVFCVCIMSHVQLLEIPLCLPSPSKITWYFAEAISVSDSGFQEFSFEIHSDGDFSCTCVFSFGILNICQTLNQVAI